MKHSSSPKHTQSSNNTPIKRASTCKKVLFRIAIALMALVGVLCIVVGGFALHLLNKVNYVPDEPYDPNATLSPDMTEPEDTLPSDPNTEPPSLSDEQKQEALVYDSFQSIGEIPVRGNEEGIRNILLLGIDGNSYVGRSDTMIVLSINDNTKTIKMVSLLRDGWVPIPGRDRDKDGKYDVEKLNASYAFGRFALLRKTIRENYRLDIDEFVGVNFKVLPILIDKMGGIDMELTAKEMTQIPTATSKEEYASIGFSPLTGDPGVYHLSGFQALQYMRIRKIDSEYKRTERQRKVLAHLIEKAKTMNYFELVDVISTALSHVSTNMTSGEFLGFASNAMKYTSYSIKNDQQMPQKGLCEVYYIGRSSGIRSKDPVACVNKLHEYIYG